MSKVSNKKGKQITGYINLCLPAQGATPAPPVGPAFGQKGLSGMEFCKQFNEATKKIEAKTPVRVKITAYNDRSFSFELLGSPVSYYLKKFAKLTKGSSEPGRSFVGTIDETNIKEIAKIKINEGLSARNIDQATKIIEGSARSIGLKIIRENENG